MLVSASRRYARQACVRCLSSQPAFDPFSEPKEFTFKPSDIKSKAKGSLQQRSITSVDLDELYTERAPNKGLTGVQPGIATGPTVSSMQNVKRFYKTVEVERDDEENIYVVCLDGKRAKTPGKSLLAVECESLANGIALEWSMQKLDGNLDPTNMPLTILVSTILDTPFDKHKYTLIQEVLRYLQTDTVRVWEDPKNNADLAGVHEETWGEYLEWVSNEFASPKLEPVRGFNYHEPPNQLVSEITNYLNSLSKWDLHSIVSVTRGAKSVILALALHKRFINIDQVYELSRLDEEMQCKEWGVVEGGHDLDRSHLKVQLAAASYIMWRASPQK